MHLEGHAGREGQSEGSTGFDIWRGKIFPSFTLLSIPVFTSGNNGSGKLITRAPKLRVKEEIHSNNRSFF